MKNGEEGEPLTRENGSSVLPFAEKIE